MKTSRKILVMAGILLLLLAAFLWDESAAPAPEPGKAASPVTAQGGQRAAQSPASPETGEGEADKNGQEAPAAILPERPEEAPEQQPEQADEAYTCTISIRCDTLLDNMDRLDAEKHELVPSDGVILSPVEATFYEGESVFDVLRRETKRAKIHMEYVDTPIYDSAYIEGIGNLYEFDCGEGSGWMYKVGDWFPNYGSSRYTLADKDVVEWVYTCDLGEDVGGGYSAGQQLG